MKIKPLKYTLIVLLLASAMLLSCKPAKEVSKPASSAKKQSEVISPAYRNLHETFINAVSEKIMGNIDKASALFQQCLLMDPANAASMYELSQIYAQKELGREALKMAENAARIEPKNEWYLFLYAQLLQRYGRYDQASGIFEKLYKLYPDKIDYILELGDNYVRSEKFDKALKAYELIEKKMGIMEMISLQKQKIYIHQGKLDKAILEIDKLIRQFPGESRYYSLLADVYLADKQPQKALETYESVLKINPDDPYIHLALYDFYLKTNDKEKAQLELIKAFANPSLDIDNKIQILLAYFSIGTKNPELNKQSYDLISVLKTAHPYDPKVYSIEGDFLYRDQKLEEASKAFHKVISIDSSRYVVWEQLIRIEGEMEKYYEVLSLCKRAIDLFPEQSVPFLFAGISSIQLKNYVQAIKYFEQCQALVVDNDDLLVNVYSFLGDTYHEIKEYKLSDENYEKALKIKNDNSYVLNNYSYYLSLRGENLEMAEKMSKRANELSPDNSTFLDTYAWILYKMGKFTEAASEIGKALKYGGNNNPEILEHNGDILYRLGKTQEAMEYWKKAQSAGKGSEFLDSKIQQNKLIE